MFEFAFQEIGISLFTSEKTKITQYCENTSNMLPIQVSEEMNWTDLTFNGQTVEYTYEYLDEVYGLIEESASEELFTLMSRYQTELVKTSYADIITETADPLIDIVVNSKEYDLRFQYCSPKGEPLFCVTLSNEELKELDKAGIHTTSDESFESLIDAYNAMLPIEFVEDCLISKCSYSAKDKTLHYEMELVNSTMAQLSSLDQAYMKEVMMESMPYMTDAPGVIARLNGFTISFRFTADCSDWWESKVSINSEEYNGLME